MKTKLSCLIFLYIVFIHSAFSQSIDKVKLDSLFSLLLNNNKAMGSITISKNGNVLYSNASGYSRIDENNKIRATENTKYRIGSITKMFTAVMIFQLIEEGKINLTTSINQFFPEIPNAEKISISNLLNHRSGLHNFTDDKDYASWMTQPKTHDEMLAIISKSKVDFEPNEKASYSNSNYIILGYMIEKITNQPYSKNITNRITSKIGLTNTYYGDKINTSNNESHSYRFANNWIKSSETDMSIPGGAGGIVSTPTDLTKFIEALFSQKLISKNSLLQMKAITDGYGMGMFQYPFNTKKAYGHNGGIDGFASSLAYFPEDSLAIAYCSNGLAYSINDILIGALSIVFGKDYSLPTFSATTFKPESLDKYLGVYSSSQLPLKIAITKNNNTLFGQATGQPSFPLEATAKDNFKFDQAGVKIEFVPDGNQFTLKQGGGSFLFTKEQ
ncbi:MAG: serine hydrolase domain-containing protein [Sphingobacteriaceae bacterium]